MAFRRGQWVKTTRDLQIKTVAAGQPVVVTIPAPSLGIHHPITPLRTYHTEFAPPMLGRALPPSRGLVEVALVDAETGLTTLLEVALSPADVVAVTDVTDIPAPRRATSTWANTPEVAADPTTA